MGPASRKLFFQEHEKAIKSLFHSRKFKIKARYKHALKAKNYFNQIDNINIYFIWLEVGSD